MFTGIIEAQGTIESMEPKGGDVRLQIESGKLDLSDVHLGDSIAVNGVCLTVVDQSQRGFAADVSTETLRRTSFNQVGVGSKVNLEKALTPASRLGGHIVSGHVDGLGEVISIEQDARSQRIKIKAPDELARYISEKGSITVDGISLTVNAVAGAVFHLNIIPHTAQETTVGHWRVGTQVNLEVDVIARYLERLVLGDRAADPKADSSGITKGFLAEHGFLK